MTVIPTYLGVFPANGFRVALNVMKPVMAENIIHITIKRIQANFRQNPTGMTHIPTSVAF